MESQSFFGKQYIQILVTLVLVGAVASLASYAYYTLKQSKGVYTGEVSINVQGYGEVQAKPDIGTFSFSVLAEGKDANEAQAKSAESINAIIAYLKEAGVEEKDIKTENYYLNPKYTYKERVCVSAGSKVQANDSMAYEIMPPEYDDRFVSSYCPPGEQVIDGYEVTQSVTVKVRDLTKSGDLISGVGSKGATNMSNLSFTIDDETVLKAQARSNAIADAKVKAEQLAKDLDVEIVKMTGFYEDQGGYPMPMYDKAMGGDMMARSESANVAPSVPTGENTIVSTVNITYEIR